MKAYKGFNSDMTCRGFQYEEGKTYETDSAELCKSGFHACENPIDVFNYYPPCDLNGNLNKFHEVELDDVSSERSNDSKVVAKKIKIGKKLSFNKIIEAHIEWVKNSINKNNKATNNGDESSVVNSVYGSFAINDSCCSNAVNSDDHSSAVNSGNWSNAVNRGFRSIAANKGFRSCAVNSGDYSSSVNIGYHSIAVNNGSRSSAVSDGDYSSAVNNGDYSIAINNGYRSGAISLGFSSSAVNNGKDGIAIAWGCDSKAKAEKGSYIVLTEWKLNKKGEYVLKGAKMKKVDGEIIKANTFYKLENGEFVEVK